MKVLSCLIHVSKICNIIVIVTFLYCSFLYMFDNVLNNLEYNVIHKKSIESSKTEFLAVFNKKYSILSINKKLSLFYYSKKTSNLFRSFIIERFFLFCKNVHVKFKRLINNIGSTYKKAKNCIYLYLKKKKKNFFINYDNYFAFGNEINEYSYVFHKNYYQLKPKLTKRKKKEKISKCINNKINTKNGNKKSLKSNNNLHYEIENTLISKKENDLYLKNEKKYNIVGKRLNKKEKSNEENNKSILKGNIGNYSIQRYDIINPKYYLIKKIKNIFKKTKRNSLEELDVIYMPDIIEKKAKTSKCKMCMVNIEKSIYALKIRNENTDDINKSLDKKKYSDIQVYYDYEDIYYIDKYEKERIKKEIINMKYLFYISLLQNKYKMINFTKRLLLSNPNKDKEKYLEIDRYKHKRINYTIKEKLGQGAYGEIWYAISINEKYLFKDVVLKKILINNDEETSQLNAMREVYFGEILKNCDNISRFIEYFEEYETNDGENYYRYFWLVFANEGYSLSKHIFETDTNNSGMLIPSSLWWSIKKENIGMLVLKDLIYQILNGINIAHKKNITHRDIKMENIFVSSKTPFTVRIGDWGSAVEFSNPQFLFIPSENEETDGYQPPESLFGHMKNNFMRLPYYDIWGIGIVFLQFVLGTKNPLEVKNKRNEIKLKKLFSKYPINALKEAIFLQSLSELCLTPWSKSSEHLILTHKKQLYSFIYSNNIIINKLKYHISNTLINIKNQSFNIVYNIISQRYNSLISIPTSPLCSDWRCLNKYNSNISFKKEYHPVDIIYKNMSHIFNESKNNFFNNNTCNDEQFQKILQERDPSGIGLPNKNARNLLRQLLQFDYTNRITAQEALNHPWFLEN
ncbi:serine/threonine protein kinase, putative [Plasmodium gallinaceum]|uniref:Cyclin-dependent kinase 2 homolog n=1 Tax=Plasmodium gallinaceum TaxID=5849 RepID=A0A1J1GVQ5_PLAGA|nr:serine/threonine protein kinase, putative [Plasmodium gallinaceum]CRG95099.1 serine/threonine protein kinase, putative [Plasmodium gallinaceum]